MEAEMSVDGRRTGVKMEVDLNFIFRSVIVSLVLFCGTLLWGANEKLNSLTSQAQITNYKLEQMEQKTSSFITIDQVNQMAKMRDLQFSTFDTKIDGLNTRLNAIEARTGMNHRPSGLKLE